ncbi:RNase H domain-containing protein [Caerostris darwini]|uniref:ribonuclease H n=1 Tax=Caerostris darwini TaxID=1538125 RepID=A0AAV4S174_9ARAC|nr:RNase H domain-containing protein [Caerostris darwini]
MEEGCCIYTDGSKMNIRFGCAIVSLFNSIEQHHELGRFSDEATVFMAELKAIEAAINYATSNLISYAKIITDSRLVLQALNNPNNDYPPIRHLKSILTSSVTKFELIWTRSHIGVVGNELVDSYAKQATLKEDIDFHLNTTFNYIKKAAHSAIKIEWQQQWTNSVKGRSVHESCFGSTALGRLTDLCRGFVPGSFGMDDWGGAPFITFRMPPQRGVGRVISRLSAPSIFSLWKVLIAIQAINEIESAF